MNRLVKCICGAVALMLVALSLVWSPGSVRASASVCACCSDEGTWYESTTRISEHELTELNRLRFDAVAKTYMTDAGDEFTKGISNVSDEYTLSLVKRQRRWELRFRDNQGHTGTLAFSVPASIGEFAADIGDGQTSAGGGPLLYKEWRLTGAVTGTGIFKQGITPQTRFRLVLQGRGNGCTDAEVFNAWKLQIFGPRTSYSFHGKFKELTTASS